MKLISVLEFRQRAKSILASVEKGQSIVLTYRGKPVARLEPIAQKDADGEDPFYRMNELSATNGKSLTNLEMDRLVYGE